MVAIHWLGALICLTTIQAVPLQSGTRAGEVELEVNLQEKMDILAEPIQDQMENLAAEFRDSVIVPILLNPFQITKLTCGSALTFYDSGATNPVVAVDLCLVGIVLAKLLLLAPLVQGALFNLLDNITNALSKIDLAGTGPEGEPFGLHQPKVVEDEVLPAVHHVQYNDPKPQDHDNLLQEEQEDDSSITPGFEYNGFGFNGWSSGLKRLSSLGADEIAAVAAGSGLFQELSSNSGLFEEFDGAALFDRIGAFAAESGVFEDVAAVVADSVLKEEVVDLAADSGLYDYLPRSFSSRSFLDKLLKIVEKLNKAVHVEYS